jgi:hypothetical protein
VKTTSHQAREQDPVWSPLRLYLRVLGIVTLVLVGGVLAFRALYSSAEGRCFATPPGASAAEYPAWKAEGMLVEVGADGFTCAYTRPDGDNERLPLGWLP